MTTPIAQGPVDVNVSHRIVKDFTRWEPNVTVVLWGRGKATADKADCPMDAPPKAQYKGDCQDCDMFMGVRFPENHGTIYWGDRFKACCWAKVANAELWGRPTAQLAGGPTRTPGSAVTTTGGSMENVLDVRGGATLRQIREMAGRAMLDGPHDYATEELEGPLLDLAVAKAVGLGAVIHKVDNAIAPFFECCVLNGCGRLQYQYTPSRGWCQGGPLVEEHRISLTELGDKWAADVRGGWVIEAATPLLAAMRALVARKLGATVRM